MDTGSIFNDIGKLLSTYFRPKVILWFCFLKNISLLEGHTEEVLTFWRNILKIYEKSVSSFICFNNGRSAWGYRLNKIGEELTSAEAGVEHIKGSVY